ncbi:hypothetical protein AAF712_014866 [Marasmius tenuissimus]|uniref:Uncharacterized protein n=1 Tax=Marasmius tenuissimus TaxID=585030 RepID=A0ABR2ZB62_9AGAR
MVPDLMGWAHGVLFKRRVLRDRGPIGDGEEFDVMGGIAFHYIQHVLSLMKEVGPILHALEVGIIRCIVEGVPLVAKYRSQITDLRPQILLTARGALEYDTSYLVYPAILHEFLKSLKNLARESSSELDRELGMIAKDFGEMWIRMKHKANSLRVLRRDLKNTEPSMLCGNLKAVVWGHPGIVRNSGTCVAHPATESSIVQLTASEPTGKLVISGLVSV